MAILRLRNLGFASGDQSILHDVDLSVAESEFMAILGPSGCGKSTLLRLIAGFERCSAGEIILDDQIVSGMNQHVPPEERGIGMVFQSYALWPHLTVAGNIGYGLRALGKAERLERIAYALATVGLRGFENRRVQSLSGGQRQRVALARCLAMQPRVLLLDEPLANLDPHLRDTMVEEFRHLHRTTGATILYVTHDQSEALALADRIAVMARGRMLQQGRPDDVWREPASADVARFLGRGEVVTADLLEPGPPARLHFCDHMITLRAPAGLKPGPVSISLRPEGMNLGPGGIPISILSDRIIGARRLVTLCPQVMNNLQLRLELPRDRLVKAGDTLIIEDGWVINPDAAPSSRADAGQQHRSVPLAKASLA